MKTLTFEECCDQVAKQEKFFGDKPFLHQKTLWDEVQKEAAELYRNQPSSLNKEELREEFEKWKDQMRHEYGELDIFDWFFSKLSAKQREVDELKIQLDKWGKASLEEIIKRVNQKMADENVSLKKELDELKSKTDTYSLRHQPKNKSNDNK